MGTVNRRAELLRSLKFTLFSASAGLIQIGAFALCNDVIRLPAWLGYLIALVLSVLWNFTLNREFTFKSANNVSKAMMQIFLFYCVFTPLSTWWGNALTEKAGWNSYAVLFLTMATNLISEYIYDRFVVYRNSMNTNRRAQREEERSESK
jgi:putative flippase GtrA